MRALPRPVGLLHDAPVRRLLLPICCLGLLAGACAAGEGDDPANIFSPTVNMGDGDAETESMGDGDPGDGDPGDGDPGDGDPGDGDPGDGDPGDGDGDDPGVCGDDVKSGDEECDGDDLGGVTCTDFGFEDGILVCANDCTLFTNACSTCGDGQIEATEACDGNNFGGLTCVDLGYASGTLACAANCSAVIESGCMQAPTCGNNVLDPGEACDGNNLNGQTCQSLGYDGGVLACTGGCQLNADGCTVQECVPLLGECNLLFDDCCEGLQCALVTCLPE